MKLTDKKITGKSVIEFIGKNYLYFGIAILVIFVVIQKPMFLEAIPLNLLYRTAAYVIMALGVGSVMMIGVGTDLSAGRMMGFLGLVASSLLERPDISRHFPNIDSLPIPVVILIILVLGAIIGAINGFFVGKFKLPAFIVTLATQIMLYGAMLVYLSMGVNLGQSISYISLEYRDFVSSSIEIGSWSIPNYIWHAIIMVALMWIIWKYTPLGKKMRLIGSNREAAKTMNVNVFATTVIVFAMAGALYGINGFIEAGRIGGPGANIGYNAEIDAITACLLGGVSLKGGIGKIGGIVAGVILFQLVTICLQWLSVSANLVYIIKGGLLLAAIIMDLLKHYYKSDNETGVV